MMMIIDGDREMLVTEKMVMIMMNEQHVTMKVMVIIMVIKMVTV